MKSPFREGHAAGWYFPFEAAEGAPRTNCGTRYAIDENVPRRVDLRIQRLRQDVLAARNHRRRPRATAPSSGLPFPFATPAETLTWIADELETEGVIDPRPAPDVSYSLRRLQNRLQELNEGGQRPTIVIDEAHILNTPTGWETLRLLLGVQIRGASAWTVVAAGQPTPVRRDERPP